MCSDKEIVGYVYKTTRISTGEFYIGRHLWKSETIDEEYFGSGLWVENYKKKYKRIWKNDLKCEVIEYHTDIVDLYKSEIEHIRRNYKDVLNKNLSMSGDGTLSPQYKSDKFFWINIETGECIHATRLEMFHRIGSKRTQITGCITGRYYSVSGWFFMGKEKMNVDLNVIINKIKRMGEYAYNFDSKEYKWINSNGDIVYKNQTQMAELLHCNKSMVNQAIKGTKLSVKGWYLFDRYDPDIVNKSDQVGKYSSSYVKETFDWVYPNGDIVFSKTPYEVFIELELKSRSHVGRVSRGLISQYRGLKLYRGSEKSS